MTISLRLFASAVAVATAPLLFSQTSVSGPATTAPAPTAAPALTLDDCVSRALQKNFDVTLQQFTTASAKEDIETAKAAYDPSFSLSGSKAVTQNPPGAATTTVNALTTTAQKLDYNDSRLSVSQKIVTGATVTVTGVLDRSKYTPFSRYTMNPAYAGDVGLTITQPLLRGAGTAVNRAAIDRARIGFDRANFDLKSVVLDTVHGVEAAYYNLVFAREQREVLRFSLDVAQKLLEENRARRSTGVATDLEVLQSEVGVANARRSLVTAEQTVRNAEDALLQLIGRFEFDQTLGSVQISDTNAPKISFDASYKRALENQPDYISSKLALDQLKLDIATAKDARLPQLDLGGSVGGSSLEANYTDASREALNGKGYNWQVDLTLTVPWGFRAANAKYRQAMLAFNRQQTLVQQLEQNIMVKVRTAIRAVETNEESVQILALATSLSERQFEQEKARYQAGLSTFRFVQQAQAELDAARVNELQARVNLRVSLADLAQLEGSSLERYNIRVADTKVSR